MNDTPASARPDSPSVAGTSRRLPQPVQHPAGRLNRTGQPLRCSLEQCQHFQQVTLSAPIGTDQHIQSTQREFQSGSAEREEAGDSEFFNQHVLRGLIHTV